MIISPRAALLSSAEGSDAADDESSACRDERWRYDRRTHLLGLQYTGCGQFLILIMNGDLAVLGLRRLGKTRGHTVDVRSLAEEDGAAYPAPGVASG